MAGEFRQRDRGATPEVYFIRAVTQVRGNHTLLPW